MYYIKIPQEVNNTIVYYLAQQKVQYLMQYYGWAN